MRTSCLVILFFLAVTASLYGQPPGPATPPQGPGGPAADTMPQPATPQVQGTQYQMPQYQQPQMTKAQLYMQVTMNIVQMIIAAHQKAPTQQQRGEDIKSTGCGGTNYHGRCNIYEFTNYDFKDTQQTCGQAAMATAMWTAGLTFKNPPVFAEQVYSYAPPKITLANLFPIKDTLGTDWHQVQYGLDKYSNQGIKYTWVDGEAQIKKYLAMNWPVMLMLDTGTLPQYNYKWWTGHWVTAFGYDANYIYVSNFPQNRMTWKQLDDAFRQGTLAKGHGTAGKGLVVWK